MPGLATASSQGQCITPGPLDVCKTPSPAGPVPIPYPNIAMTSNGSGSSKVKVKCKQALRKGDKISMSTGDDAGVAGGVVSGKIKGPAEFIVGWPTVKVEGKQWAFHLAPVKQNDGNTVGMLQVPSC